MRRGDSGEQDAERQRERTPGKCADVSGMVCVCGGGGELESTGEVNWRLKLDDMIQRDH